MANPEEVLPEIRFKPVVRRYQMIKDLLPLIETGTKIDAGYLEDLRTKLSEEEQYSLKDCAREPLGILLNSFAGKTLTISTLDTLAWRLAACYDVLNAGSTVELQFSLVEKPDWLALSIVSSCFVRLSRAMKPLLEVQFRVLSGPFGGLVFWQLIPHGWFISKLGRELGGGTREKRYPDHRELAGFWLIGKLDTWNPSNPRLADFRATSSALEHNRDLRKVRNQPCPLKFTHTCHECWVGSLELIPERLGEWEHLAKCSAFRRSANKGFVLYERATHPRHFILRKCFHCRRDEAPFEPTHRSRYCVTCQAEFVRSYRRF